MEEEIRTTEQGDGANNESTEEISNNSPIKRGRGRPQGSKKLKVCVTDVRLLELVSGISNGEPTTPGRKRGRPKLSGTKLIEQEQPEDSDGDDPVQTPPSRGRPKGSKNQAKGRGRPRNPLNLERAEALSNGGSDTPKKGRGRPKASTMGSAQGVKTSEDSCATPKRTGRPKGSLNKPKLLSVESEEAEVESEGEVDESLIHLRWGRSRLKLQQIAQDAQKSGIKRGRGRPRKIIELESENGGGPQPAKRGRGRPKGSLNKKPAASSQKVSPKRKNDHSVNQSAKRGRPRKHPSLSPEVVKKPKLWKPLGRPRKYPRTDPPEGAPPSTPRGRGRPRKSESKKGAHLRKSLPTASSSPDNSNDGFQKKVGRTPNSEGDKPRKRGRPKGSPNKNKARSETQLDSTLPEDSKSDSSAFGVGHEGEPMEHD